MISWIIGAAALIGSLLRVLSKEVPLKYVFADWVSAGLFALAAIPFALLGLFVGGFFAWPFVRPLCSRINGGPLRIGDAVVILCGPDRGRLAKVYETPTGQGGWQLACVTVEDEDAASENGIYETYQLLKTNANQGRQATPSPSPAT